MEVDPAIEPLELSGTTPGGSTALISSSPDRSFSNISSRSSDSQAALKSEEYRQLFRLPADEVLLQDFNCALQENILLQGHLYVFTSYVCFYSNIFGFETKKIIHCREITGIKRAKTAGIFPTAIEIYSGEKRIYFVSFLSRDEAFKLIEEGCSQKNIVSEAVTQAQASPSSSEEAKENGYVTEEVIKLPGDEELVSTSSGKRREDTTVNPQEADVDVGKASSHIVRNGTWHILEADPPEIPNEYTKVAESTFPVKVEEFFEHFFSDDALKFVKDFHSKSNDKDFKCSSWLLHETMGHTRTIHFQHPIKIYFGAKFGRCEELQSFHVYKNSHLVIKTSQDISDVPYSDYFSVKAIWDVKQEGEDAKEGCTLSVYLQVAFTKKTVFKGKIIQSTFEECRESYALWIEMALEQLTSKKSRNQGKNLSSQQSTNAIIKEAHEISPDINVESGSVGSFVRTIANKFSKFGAPNPTVSHLLVVSFVAIFLMQMSIIALLFRPATVAVVSSGGMDSKGLSPEYVEWMERRVRHLRDDIYDAENRLQRLRHEHEWLKSQLKFLR